MLSPEEISNLSINSEIAKSVLAQAEKMHIDLIDSKKSVEQKATSFFSSYITIAVALFGLAGAITNTSVAGLHALPVFIAGVGFVIGAISFSLVQGSNIYGINGSDPRCWMKDGWINADGDITADFNAHLALQYIEKIDATTRANSRKRFWLNIGMTFGILSVLTIPFVFTDQVSSLVLRLVPSSH